MKLLFQADDFGLTESTTCGILKGIREGFIRNTGLFVNMPSSVFAAKHIPEYPHVCFGQDINLVAGKPVSDLALVPSLVSEDGNFITSVVRLKQGNLLEKQGNVYIFEEDPYVYEEVLIEIENQVKRFIELVGRKPGYLHGHSMSTPNTRKAMKEISDKYGLIQSYQAWQDHGVYRLPVDWNPKPFSFVAQMETDVEMHLLNALETAKNQECCSFICHAGFIDMELFEHSTYTAIRMKDLKAATSDQVKQFLQAEAVTLITYDDLMKHQQ